MTVNSKRKGKEGELEVAELLRAAGFSARRGVQYQGGTDSPDIVHNLPALNLSGGRPHLEVKRTQAFRLYDALSQAQEDAPDDDVPVVVHRPNGKEWVAVMTLADFLDLCNLIESQRFRNGG